VLDRLLEALRHSRADFAEIRYERAWITTVTWRERRLEVATDAVDAGGTVRCLDQGRGWGVASIADGDDLAARLSVAHELSRATRPDAPVALAPVPVREGHDAPDLGGDVRAVPLDEKRRLVEGLNSEMLGFDRRIVDTRLAYRDVVAEHWYANSEGTRMHGVRPDVQLAALAMARDGGTVERALASFGASAGWLAAQGHEERFRSAARQAVSLLGAQPVRSGTYPVLLDPRLAAALAHEAVGHLCEADGAAEPGAYQAPLGARLGSPLVTVGDDGSVPGLRGTRPFDDEGTPTGNTLLLQNGVVVGHLHTRETAARDRARPTGSARTPSWRHAPLARLSNVYIANGSGSRADLLRDVRLGVYACDVIDSRRDGDRITFTAGHGYMIRDGELAELVKHVVIAGRVSDLLGAVDRVAGDFRWHDDGGGCTRRGQGPVAVADGAPHVRLERAEIRGVAP
jgi:TldD protein